jgi:hypothetical protein
MDDRTETFLFLIVEPVVARTNAAQTPGEDMSTLKLKKNVHGEGNKEADRKFREDEAKFVRSEEGKKKISEAGNLTEEEAAELEKIAEKTKSHAKEEDPAIKHGGGSRH